MKKINVTRFLLVGMLVAACERGFEQNQAAQSMANTMGAWQGGYVATGVAPGEGRPGFFVSMFQKRVTGAVVFVTCQLQNGKKYVLMTLQERIVDGKPVVFAEPPAGFFNAEFPAEKADASQRLPHQVVEEAERAIDKQSKQTGKKPTAEDISNVYQKVWQHYQNLPNNKKVKYAEDNNTLDTAKRELLEESGLDIREYPHLQTQVVDWLDNKMDLVAVYHFHISKIKSLPKLKDEANDEIQSAFWVPIHDVSQDGLSVSKGNTFLVKNSMEGIIVRNFKKLKNQMERS